MPLAEACHVAVQRQAPALRAGSGGPRLRIVSLHAEDGHRTTAFEMELSDLVRARGLRPLG